MPVYANETWLIPNIHNGHFFKNETIMYNENYTFDSSILENSDWLQTHLRGLKPEEKVLNMFVIFEAFASVRANFL